jgi:hypothetical protein
MPCHDTYPVMAMQDMWHAAAPDVEEDCMRALAGFIRAEADPQGGLALNITICFAYEAQANGARRYVRRAVNERDRNE